MTATNGLPADFFAQPIEALGDEPLQFIYSEVVARLREENPDADTIETMMIERVAFLYVHIRYKETNQLFAHDRAHKETLQLWVQMAAQLRKQRERDMDLVEVKDRIVTAIHVAVSDTASATLPPEQAKEFKKQLAEALDAAGMA